MTLEKQRITIAEACGWTVINDTICDPKPEVVNGQQTGNIDINPVATLPDYLNDLNAMHEAMQHLPDALNSGPNGFVNNIVNVVQKVVAPRPIFRGPYFYVVTATAAERAEAFLRTIGKWEE